MSTDSRIASALVLVGALMAVGGFVASELASPYDVPIGESFISFVGILVLIAGLIVAGASWYEGRRTPRK